MHIIYYMCLANNTGIFIEKDIWTPRFNPRKRFVDPTPLSEKCTIFLKIYVILRHSKTHFFFLNSDCVISLG